VLGITCGNQWPPTGASRGGKRHPYRDRIDRNIAFLNGCPAGPFEAAHRRFVELMFGRDPEPLAEPACPSRRVRP
jgi:hypothetical protein